MQTFTKIFFMLQCKAERGVFLVIYCFDLDGVITTCGGFGASHKNIPTWVIKVVLSVYKPRIRKEIMVLIDQIKAEKDQVAIVTKRDLLLKDLTVRFLDKKKVPFDEIFFVGRGEGSTEKKLTKIKEINPCVYFDDNEEIVKEALKAGINSILI